MQGCLRFPKTSWIALLLSLSASLALEAAPQDAPQDESAATAAPADDAAMSLRDNTYIAVYYSNSKGNWGWGRSTDLETAKALARGYCNENSCQFIFWTQNACAVLATGSDLGYGWAWNTDRLTAVQTALQNCSNFASSCKVVINECT